MAGFRAIWEDNTDPKDMSDRQLELWARAAEKALAFRQQCDPGQFYDMHFSDFMSDPMATIQNIYFAILISPYLKMRKIVCGYGTRTIARTNTANTATAMK